VIVALPTARSSVSKLNALVESTSGGELNRLGLLSAVTMNWL
jgi:hypothetical protein